GRRDVDEALDVAVAGRLSEGRADPIEAVDPLRPRGGGQRRQARGQGGRRVGVPPAVARFQEHHVDRLLRRLTRSRRLLPPPTLVSPGPGTPGDSPTFHAGPGPPLLRAHRRAGPPALPAPGPASAGTGGGRYLRCPGQGWRTWPRRPPVPAPGCASRPYRAWPGCSRHRADPRRPAP